MQISMKAARSNAKLTQTEMAKRLGVSKTTICYWETGRTEPKLSQFNRFCEICNVPPCDVFLPSA